MQEEHREQIGVGREVLWALKAFHIEEAKPGVVGWRKEREVCVGVRQLGDVEGALDVAGVQRRLQDGEVWNPSDNVCDGELLRRAHGRDVGCRVAGAVRSADKQLRGVCDPRRAGCGICHITAMAERNPNLVATISNTLRS